MASGDLIMGYPYDAILGGYYYVDHGFTFTRDSRCAVIADDAGTVSIWKPAVSSLVRKLPVKFEYPVDVEVSQDNTKLIVADQSLNPDDIIWLFDLATGDLITKYNLGLTAPLLVEAAHDGIRIATCFGGATRIWDINTGNILLEIIDAAVWSGMAWSLDDQRLLIAQSPGLQIFDTTTGDLVLEAPLPQMCYSISVWPDGSGKALMDYLVVDTATGSILLDLSTSGLITSGYCSALSPEGSKIFISFVDTTSETGFAIAVCDSMTGDILASFGRHIYQGGQYMVLSPDGSMLLTQNWGWLDDDEYIAAVWSTGVGSGDAFPGCRILSPQWYGTTVGEYSQISWTPYGHVQNRQDKFQIQIASDPDFLNIVHDSGEIIGQTTSWTNPTPYADAEYYARLRIFDGTEWSEWAGPVPFINHKMLGYQHSLIDDYWLGLAAITRNGTLLALYDRIDKLLIVRSMITGNLISEFPAPYQRLYSLVISPDVTLIAGGDYGYIYMYDLLTGDLLSSFNMHGTRDIHSIACSIDGNMVASIDDSWPSQVKVWDFATHSILFQTAIPEEPLYGSDTDPVVNFNPSGVWVYAAQGSVLNTYEIGTGTLISQIDVGEPITSISIWPAEAEKVLVNDKIVDALHGIVLSEFHGYGLPCTGGDISPDGAYAISAHANKVAYLWETKTGNVIRSYVGHEAAIFGVFLAWNYSRVITASDDSTVRLWDIRSYLGRQGDLTFRVGNQDIKMGSVLFNVESNMYPVVQRASLSYNVGSSKTKHSTLLFDVFSRDQAISWGRDADFVPLADVIVYRKINGIEYATYLQDILHASIESDGSMGAQTLTLEVNNESGKYNPSADSDVNYVDTAAGRVWHPLFKPDNKVIVRLGVRYPDNSEVWEPELYGPFYVDEPEYGIAAGEHTFRITARDRMKFLMRDIYVGKFEPDKIFVPGETLATVTPDVCIFAHQNICKEPKPIIAKTRLSIITTYLLSGYTVDYAAGRLFLDKALVTNPLGSEQIYSSYYYYDMTTNKLGDVLRTILIDAGIPDEDIELSFVSSDGTVIEPTLPKVEFTYEDGKTHFDCIRQILRDFMPPNYLIYASGDKIKGCFVYQKAVPDGEIVTAEQIRATISEEELYTKVVAYGRTSLGSNLSEGKPVTDVAPSEYIRQGSITYLTDGKTTTQRKWCINDASLTPCDLFVVDLLDVYPLGRVMMLQGDDGCGNVVRSIYVIYKSMDGSTWEPLCNDAMVFELSSGQWLDIGESSLGDNNFARYLKVHCLRTADEVSGWENIGIREFRVFPSTKVVGEASLWVNSSGSFTVPNTPPYTTQITGETGAPVAGIISHPRLKPKITLSNGTELKVIENTTGATESPDPNVALVAYGGLEGASQVTFHPSLAGMTGTIQFSYVPLGIPKTPMPGVIETYIQITKQRFDTINRVGPKTLVLPESYARTSTSIAWADAIQTLALLWKGTETAELTLPWAPYTKLLGTYRYVNFELGINSTYLVEGISIDLTMPSVTLTLTNYRYGGISNASPRLSGQMTRLIKDTINGIGILPKPKYKLL